MPVKAFQFQPGAILHDVLSGAFRARGTTLEAWCKANGIAPMNVRQAAVGLIRSDAAQANLERAIAGAGRDFVVEAYRRRIADHYEQIMRGAA